MTLDDENHNGWFSTLAFQTSLVQCHFIVVNNIMYNTIFHLSDSNDRDGL